MIVLNQLFKLIKLLNSEKGEKAIAAGLAVGFILGLIPSNVIWLTLFLLILFVFRINGAAFFLSWGVVKILAYPLDPVLDQVGFTVLTSDGLKSFWTLLYNAPVLPWSHFNNTVFMGSLVIGLASALPLYFVFLKLIRKYRDSWLKAWKQWKWVKAWKATQLYKLYMRYHSAKARFS